MKPVKELAHKGEMVEEWTDVHFFRPLGMRIARALLPTRVSADQVTLLCLIVGLLAGHLFVYQSTALNLLGVALFVVSDLFDSADGQLARLRGVSSRFGRVLDGLSDTSRFLNLYLHIGVRLTLAGWGWPGFFLVAAAALSHSYQSTVVDFVKNAFLAFGIGAGGEVDLVEDLPAASGGFRRFAARLYRDYVRRQEFLFPVSVRLIRLQGGSAPSPEFRASYRARQQPVLPWLALIGANIRFVILAAVVLAGHAHPSWFLWVTVVPLNVVMTAVLVAHELNAAALLEGRQAFARVAARGA